MSRAGLWLALATLLAAPAFAQVPDEAATPASSSPSVTTTTATGGPAGSAEAARLQAEAARLERVQAEQDASIGGSAEPTDSLWPTFIRTAIMLSAVCLLAYLLLGKLMPRLMNIEPPTAPRRLLKVVDRLAIDQKRSVMILQLGDAYFLVGAAEQNISLMSKLDAEQIERLVAEAGPSNPGLARLGDLFARRHAKGS